MIKKILILFSLLSFTNIFSCITPPPGGCAYSDDKDKSGEILITSIEEFKGDTFKCYEGKTIKFKFISNYTNSETIYSQSYPNNFIKNNQIEIGKKYKGLIQTKYTGPCKDQIFEFTDFFDSFISICDKKIDQNVNQTQNIF